MRGTLFLPPGPLLLTTCWTNQPCGWVRPGRRVEVLGATAVVRHARRRTVIEDPWLRRMLVEKAPGER